MNRQIRDDRAEMTGETGPGFGLMTLPQATTNNNNGHPARIPGNPDLASYHRLVELQKQMIELAQQHAQSRRDFEVLRAQVTRPAPDRLRRRPAWLQWLRALRFRWEGRKGKRGPAKD